MNSNILQSSDLKSTKCRRAVLSVLEKADSPLTAEAIYQEVLREVHMSVSTTYRTLAVLSEKHILLKNLSQDGKAYYQMNNHRHQHHLICTVCNEIVPVDDCPLEALERALTDKTGYIITGHNLEFMGICPRCAKEIKL